MRREPNVVARHEAKQSLVKSTDCFVGRISLRSIRPPRNDGKTSSELTLYSAPVSRNLYRAQSSERLYLQYRDNAAKSYRREDRGRKSFAASSRSAYTCSRAPRGRARDRRSR